MRPPKRSRQKARDAYKGAGKAMYESYKGPCMIPALADDGFVETEKMSGCHVIGGRFLELIATEQGQVCTWNMNAHQIGKKATFSELEITYRSAVPRFEPFEPERTSINSYLSTSKFACQPHDDKAFKVIDAPKTIDLQAPDHRFRLAFRAIAGALANTEGILSYCGILRDQFSDPGYVKRVATQNNIRLNVYDNYVQSFLEQLDYQVQEIEARARTLRAELREWQRMYVRPAERQIVSCYLLAVARVGVAISAVWYQEKRPIATYTVLPRADVEPGTNLCDIILTSRQANVGFFGRLMRQDRYLEKEARKVEDLLAAKPAIGLPQLIKTLSMNPATFFFVSPDDYYNGDIISAADRHQIEQEIASIANDQVPR